MASRPDVSYLNWVLIYFNTGFMHTSIDTPGRRQSKTLSTIDERGSKIDRNSVFDCHLSPVWRQKANENSVSIDVWSTFLDSIDVFDCRLPGVIEGRGEPAWTKITKKCFLDHFRVRDNKPT